MKAMTALSRPMSLSILVLTMMASALMTSGCTDNEPEQRAAFIGILEKNVLSRPGMRFTKLTEEEQKQIGKAYTEQYEFLGQLNNDPELDAVLSNFPKSMANVMKPGSMEEKISLLKEAATAISDAKALVVRRLAESKSKRDTFTQPEDLKAVYDKAFEKRFTIPLETAEEALGVSLEAIGSVQALFDYVAANPGSATYSGSGFMIQSKDHEARIQELIKDVAEKAKAAQEAGQKLMQLAQ